MHPSGSGGDRAYDPRLCSVDLCTEDVCGSSPDKTDHLWEGRMKRIEVIEKLVGMLKNEIVVISIGGVNTELFSRGDRDFNF